MAEPPNAPAGLTWLGFAALAYRKAGKTERIETEPHEVFGVGLLVGSRIVPPEGDMSDGYSGCQTATITC